MNPFENFTPSAKDAEKAMSLPLGLASPLWFAFAGAATAGVAYWWMSRWSRPVNIEAGEVPPEAEPVVAQAVAAYEAALEAVEEITETLAAAAPVFEAAAEPLVEAVQESAETLVETTQESVEPVVAVADDLTRLVGIGPRLAASLAERGVTRFAQIADWGADDLALYDRELGLKGRAVRDAWVAQARRFAEA